MPESFFFPVYSGILTSEHREKIGSAIWEFLWCISKTTKEVVKEGESLGIVLGGRPVKYSEIADDLGVSERTAKRNMSDLEKNGYIKTTRAKYGIIIHVLKSKKFLSRSDRNVTFEDSREDKNVTSQQPRSDKNVLSEPSRSDKNGTSNKDIKKDLDIKKTDIKNASLLDSEYSALSNESDGMPITDPNKGEISLSSPENDGMPITDDAVHEISFSAKEALERIEAHYLALRGIGLATSPEDFSLMKSLLDDNIPVDTIIAGIDKAFANYKPKFAKDRIRHFSYCDPVIRDLHYRNTERQKMLERGKQNGSTTRKDMGPGMEESKRAQEYSGYSSGATDTSISQGRTGWLRKPTTV